MGGAATEKTADEEEKELRDAFRVSFNNSNQYLTFSDSFIGLNFTILRAGQPMSRLE